MSPTFFTWIDDLVDECLQDEATEHGAMCEEEERSSEPAASACRRQTGQPAVAENVPTD